MAPIAFAFVDTIVVTLILICLVVVADLGHLPDGLDRLLAARITVTNLIIGIAFLGAWRFTFSRVQEVRRKHSTGLQEAETLIIASTLACCPALAFPLLSKGHTFTLKFVILFWLLVTLWALVSRMAMRVGTLFSRGYLVNTLIVGSGEAALQIFRRSELNQEIPGLNILGFVDDLTGENIHSDVASRLLGSLENLSSILMAEPIEKVLIALPIKSRYDEIQKVISACENAGIDAEYLPKIFEASLATTSYKQRAGQDVIHLRAVPQRFGLAIKRAIDITASLAALVILSPLICIIAISVRLTSPGPAIFVQKRYGINRRLFSMYKFRTMVQNAEALQSGLEQRNEASGPVFKIRDDPRTTRLGKFLRKTSLDELPQFFNVLKGEMSLVGPRPLPLRDVSKFSEAWLMRRFSVKPGLTCLWQISGRSNSGFEHWIELDLNYVRNWSLGLDFYILARTLPAVIRGEGAM